ncbi:DUF5671 domain-containing protein [Amaricoccus sp.]|uniref:DUF5671 domain-containing protein n=1 Tax=Amaricoccus sp. TaxID=1872485 RepID=UPI001B6278A9|nr:DUF5671 domain-containing protein [Amaricoccus sp.]MBP7003594.1 hypothetical protein [Amaricoccus sp.]
MRAPEPLAAFVRDALAAGGARPAIAAALRDAGWSEAEVQASLAAWVDVPGLPPAPRPRAAVSPRDALAFGVLFVALGIVVVQLGVLAFSLIDVWVPDPLAGADYSGSGALRWAVAALVVAWPVWAALTLSLARAEAADPGRRRSAVGHWLTAAALFIAAAVGIGDLIAVVAALLGGELTLRFLLKAAVVAAIAAAVFAAYRPALGPLDESPGEERP